MAENTDNDANDGQRVTGQQSGQSQNQPVAGDGSGQPSAQTGQAPAAEQRAPAQQGQSAAGAQQESVIDAIQRPVPKSYIKGISGSMAAMGALLGVAVYLVATFGGRSLFPGMVQEFSGTAGVAESLSFTHQIVMAYVANELAIYLAFLMAPVFGILVAYRLDDTVEAKMGTAGVGVALGTIAFVFIVAFFSSMTTPSASELLTAQEALPGGTGLGAQQQFLEGMDLGSIDIGTTLTNSIAVAVPAGVAAAAVIYFDENFFH